MTDKDVCSFDVRRRPKVGDTPTMPVRFPMLNATSPPTSILFFSHELSLLVLDVDVFCAIAFGKQMLINSNTNPTFFIVSFISLFFYNNTQGWLYVLSIVNFILH
jgi:hypothetical protein